MGGRDQADELAFMRDVLAALEKKDKDRAELEKAVKAKMGKPGNNPPGHAR